MSTASSDHSGLPSSAAILGHKPGLFVLFFTEMWERFSYYGMRALLVLFLTASFFNDGWGWSRSEALALYGWYTGLVYITPIIGGFLADKLFGYRLAVVLGALVMTIGHASMAFETATSFYIGLICLILGNGLFKPNISSIVGQLYDDEVEKRDAAYTIFYMGINAGAFLGILLCGYIGEKVGWSYGFGLAGIFMLLGMIQFYFAQNIFGELGKKPQAKVQKAADAAPDANAVPANVERDRVIVIGIFAFFTIFFWWAFEQAGGSMTIFAGDYTNRVLKGGAATAFNVINLLLTIVPLIVVTWVLAKLCKATFGKYAISNLCLVASFVVIWGIALWLIQNDFTTKAYEVSYTDINGTQQSGRVRTTADLEAGSTVKLNYNKDYTLYNPTDEGNKENTVADNVVKNKDGKAIGSHFMTKVAPVTKESLVGLFWKEKAYSELSFTTKNGTNVTHKMPLPDNYEEEYAEGNDIQLLVEDKISIADEDAKDTIDAKVVALKDQEVEVAASWFGILNSFFIIAFAPLFSKFWEKNIIRSGAVKFALGLILLGTGFGALAYGSMEIPLGAKTASVSMMWLVLAYLLHTLGELCLSPVGLSYVSKLAPARLVGLMFGLWFIANFVANTAAGLTGSFIDPIVENQGMSVFFLIFTVIPIGAGIVLILIKGKMKEMMHGIE